jgi:hypothetical protein
MANAFNSVLKGIIFEELYVASGDITQFIHFVFVLYAFEIPFVL